MSKSLRVVLLSVALLAVGCASSRAASRDSIAEVLAAEDRAPADTTLDAQRKLPDVLAFSGVGPGMTVVDVITGPGHTAEALSRVVGDQGRVYAANPTSLLDLKPIADQWVARTSRYRADALTKLDNADVTQLSAIPEGSVDIAYVFLAYHDLPLLKIDAAAMNRAIFRALKSGGVYVVADHSAKPGASDSDALKLHRANEATVVKQVTAAGFSAPESSPVLLNASDARDWDDSPF
ncbi:MAG: class I SAM-dependent methyltransferase, partial [Archangium sp.]|nr:class I SAM-dependent methyltransferase [Archangium sp.]